VLEATEYSKSLVNLIRTSGELCASILLFAYSTVRYTLRFAISKASVWVFARSIYASWRLWSRNQTETRSTIVEASYRVQYSVQSLNTINEQHDCDGLDPRPCVSSRCPASRSLHTRPASPIMRSLGHLLSQEARGVGTCIHTHAYTAYMHATHVGAPAIAAKAMDMRRSTETTAESLRMMQVRASESSAFRVWVELLLAQVEVVHDGREAADARQEVPNDVKHPRLRLGLAVPLLHLPN
jgi:hypothetical protein